MPCEVFQEKKVYVMWKQGIVGAKTMEKWGENNRKVVVNP